MCNGNQQIPNARTVNPNTVATRISFLRCKRTFRLLFFLGFSLLMPVDAFYEIQNTISNDYFFQLILCLLQIMFINNTTWSCFVPWNLIAYDLYGSNYIKLIVMLNAENLLWWKTSLTYFNPRMNNFCLAYPKIMRITEEIAHDGFNFVSTIFWVESFNMSKLIRIQTEK